jgi:glycerol-3-phosphate dehydrogenase
MNFGATLLLLLLAASAAVCAPQKAEPNPQVPATPQAISPGALGSSHAPGISAAENATLRGRIQQALQNDTSLSGSHIAVSVTSSDIELTGMVASSKDKETADRIAQSFDGNRHFTDKLVVNGQNQFNPAAKNGASPPR